MALRAAGRLAAVCLIQSLVAGCHSADPAVTRSEKAADDLLNARQSLSTSEQAVAQSQGTLRTLSQSKGDLRPPFAAFVTQMEAVRKQAERQQFASEAVLSQATAYCAAREKDVSTITNDKLRTTAQTRLALMQKQSQTIKETYARMNEGFATYLRNLSDLQTYLANDLNYSALTPAQGPIADAVASGESLRAMIRELAGQVELMSNTLSPAPMPSSQWPTTLRSTTAPADRE